MRHGLHWLFAGGGTVLAHRRARLLLPLLIAAACSPPPIALFPPAVRERSISVLPVSNAAGGPIWIDGGSLVEALLPSAERSSVEDLLAADLRSGLAERGFHVIEPEAAARQNASENVLRMSVEIRRWSADTETEPRYVVVALNAALVEANGNALWSSDLGPRPFPVTGSVNLGQAHSEAAAHVARELLRAATGDGAGS